MVSFLSIQQTSQRLIVIRFASTEPMTAPESLGLLNSQREKRPTSPHFTIYQPQVCSPILLHPDLVRSHIGARRDHHYSARQ